MLLGGGDDDEQSDTTRPSTPAPSIPSGPACSFRSHSGSCIAVSTCYAARGSAFSSRVGANGCQSFALNIQCCIKSSSLLNDEAGDIDIEGDDAVDNDANNGEMSAGVIAAIVVGVILVLLVLVTVVYVVHRRQSATSETASYAAASQIPMANDDVPPTTVNNESAATDAKKTEPAFV